MSAPVPGCTRALCCECGTLRTVSLNFYGYGGYNPAEGIAPAELQGTATTPRLSSSAG